MQSNSKLNQNLQEDVAKWLTYMMEFCNKLLTESHKVDWAQIIFTSLQQPFDL